MNKINFFQLLVFIFSIAQGAYAGVTDGKIQFLLKDKMLTLKPDSGFHLNKDAPAKLIIISPKEIINPIKKEKEEFNFNLGDNTKNLLIDFYVCDDKNTTCERHKKNISVIGNSLQINNPEEKLNSSSSAYSPAPALLNKHNFIIDNLEAAKAQAKKEKKLLLVDFNAPWCPACLRLETEVF